MSHFVYTVGVRSNEKAQMLVKYELRPQNEINSMPRERVKMCSRLVVFLCIILCLLLLYIPISYPPTFGKKSFDVNVEGWGVNASRSLPLYISPVNETAILANRSMCAEPLLLLVVVCSSVGNFRERAAIRETWGNFSDSDYTVIFLLGATENSTLQEIVTIEFIQHQDIIQENFIDSYNNLTLKSVMLLKQVANHCPSVEYILKSDDDMFIHISNLLNLIRHLQEFNMKDVLLGELICDAKPIQDTRSKWYAPSYLFDGKVYPKYLSGTGYLMDRSAAIKLYNASLVTPFFHLEDVYITGMCAQKAKLKPRDHAGFSFRTRPLDPCLYIAHKYVTTSHRVSADKMRQLWAGLNKPKICQLDPRQIRLHASRLASPLRKSRC